jgi:hypothetical protein
MSDFKKILSKSRLYFTGFLNLRKISTKTILSQIIFQINFRRLMFGPKTLKKAKKKKKKKRGCPVIGGSMSQ